MKNFLSNKNFLSIITIFSLFTIGIVVFESIFLLYVLIIILPLLVYGLINTNEKLNKFEVQSVSKKKINIIDILKSNSVLTSCIAFLTLYNETNNLVKAMQGGIVAGLIVFLTTLKEKNK